MEMRTRDLGASRVFAFYLAKKVLVGKEKAEIVPVNTNTMEPGVLVNLVRKGFLVMI